MTEKVEETKEDETPSMIDRAEAAAEKIETALKKFDEAMSKNILAGRAEAGTAPEEKKEVSAKDYKELVLSGGLDE